MKFLFILFIILLLLFCSKHSSYNDSSKQDSLYKAYLNTQPSQVDTSAWTLLSFIKPDDSLHVYEFQCTGEMGLGSNNIYCMAVFENLKTNEVKCVAPWLNGSGMILQKSNLLSMNPILVLKKDTDIK